MAYKPFIFAALVRTALAHRAVDAVGYAPAVITDAPTRVLDKRQNARCTESVISQLMPPDPTNSDFADWAISEGGNRLENPGCTVTVPASFSDDFLEYYSDALEWMETVESAAAEVTTDCGYLSLGLSLTQLCSESQTIYWEGDGASTATATQTGDSASSTVLEPVEIPAETIWIGEGQSNGGSSGGGGGGSNSSDGDSDSDSAGSIIDRTLVAAFAVTIAGFLGAMALL